MKKVLYVEWVDSSGDPGWKYAGTELPTLAKCASVGFFIAEDKHRLVLALSCSIDGLHFPWGDLISIPVVAITRRRVLK